MKKLNMGLLMQQSGLSRQTIHFYLRKGLLPRANKTSQTYALYRPDTLELLRLIKDCQTELRLSLNEIVQVFQQANYDVKRIDASLEARRSARKPGQQRDAAPLGPPRISSDGASPPPEWLAEERASGLLPASGSMDSQPNADLIQSIWELSRLGIKPDSLKSIGGLVKAGAESELTRFLHAKCRDYPDAIRLLHAFRQFIRCKHEDALRNAFAANRQGLRDLFIGPNRKCIFPSETLLAKMGLNREIDRLLNHLDREPDHKPSLIDLARAYFLRSDWLNLCGVCEKILQLDPANVRAVADKARAISYMGRADDAVQLLEERLRKGSDPLLKFRLGQALILQARNSSVPEFLGLVVKKQQLTTEALRDARDPRVRMWIRLDMALDDLSVSDPLQLNPPRASDLERLHREYQSISEKGLSVLSRMNLVRGRTLAAYALYLVYLRDRHPKTEQLLRKTTQMDPYAALTTRAASASKSSEPPLVVREIKRKSARTN